MRAGTTPAHQTILPSYPVAWKQNKGKKKKGGIPVSNVGSQWLFRKPVAIITFRESMQWVQSVLGDEYSSNLFRESLLVVVVLNPRCYAVLRSGSSALPTILGIAIAIDMSSDSADPFKKGQVFLQEMENNSSLDIIFRYYIYYIIFTNLYWDHFSSVAMIFFPCKVLYAHYHDHISMS